MRKYSFQLLAAFGVVLSLVIILAPSLGGADPKLPDEAFAQTIAADDPFPHQKELAARVNFWRHVFGIWNTRQVALHDMSNPGLIYEVLTLPEKRYNSNNRKDFINEHVEDLVHRLHSLEQKVALGNDLDDSEQGLLDKFRTLGKMSQLAGAHTRVRMQRGIRDKFVQGVEISGRYDAIFRRIFRTHGVPEDLAFLPHVESSFQSSARSGVGAVGIWQFTLPAARIFMNVNAAVDERYDPVLAAEGCARYLARAYEKLGDWGLAITSYNHGIGGMARAESEFGTNFPRILEDYEGPLFGFDSRNFYVEFLAAREVARNAERYFAEVNRERPLSWEKVALERPAPIYKVARDYGVTLSELTEMNAALTNSALKGQVSLPEGTSIWLPKGTQERLASRSTEDEAPVVRQIRVVRAPDSTADRMVAMIENPLSTSTKVDVPAARRVTFVRSKAGRNSNGRTSEHKNVSARHVKTEKVAVEKATVSTKAVAEKSPSAKAKVASVKVTSPKDSHTKVAAAEITPRSVKSSEHQVKTLTKTEAKAKVKVVQASAASTKSVSGKGSSAAPIKVATVKAAPVKAANKPVVVSKKSGGKVAAATKGSSSHRG